MPERKSLSKKIRFEVFKRDKFQCQYCGRQAPDVILHVDHIVPIYEDGTNDIINLVTSCLDCNLGKGKRTLSDDSVIKKQQLQINMQAEKEEQIRFILDWKKSIVSTSDVEFNAINEFFGSLTKYVFVENQKKEICGYVNKYGLPETLDSI